MHLIRINAKDNVSVCPDDGHKYANRDIASGETVVKYGYPIGIATSDIRCGEHVHSHNLKTGLEGQLDYVYNPVVSESEKQEPVNIEAYVRKSGDIGIRNDIWVINTVGCINKVAEKIASDNGALAFPHPYGCSQLGDDFELTAAVLCQLIRHPNAGGVLVLGLGCENTNINEIKKRLGDFDEERIRFLNIQDCEDELLSASQIITELKEIAQKDKRETVSIDRLRIGMKCGGSDGLSGITANPLVGKMTDRLTAMGGSAVLTEVPEMFGAEQLLFNRCNSRETFSKAVSMINSFKQYFIENNQPVSKNPSPGNKAGGITTLEEKALGCVQKGGSAVITDVLDYGDTISVPGLSLLNGPGNDIVAVTNLTAVGCHMILFTTGRGTPLGAPVPTIKISTNTRLAENKPKWIDFDAGKMLEGDSCEDALLYLIIRKANGEQTKNEKNGYREIAIFKDGVTL